MNRRRFLMSSMAATASVPLSFVSTPLPSSAAPAAGESRVAVLLVDTDRVTASIDERIYGQFLEDINHSVEDGLFAEQIRGAGFEGEDFTTYWESFSDRGAVEIADVEFQNGKKSVRLHVRAGEVDGRFHRMAFAREAWRLAGVKMRGDAECSVYLPHQQRAPALALTHGSGPQAFLIWASFLFADNLLQIRSHSRIGMLTSPRLSDFLERLRRRNSTSDQRGCAGQEPDSDNRVEDQTTPGGGRHEWPNRVAP